MRKWEKTDNVQEKKSYSDLVFILYSMGIQNASVNTLTGSSTSEWNFDLTIFKE